MMETLNRSYRVTDQNARISSEIRRALFEARLARKIVYAQIEELAHDKGFRRRHCNAMLSEILSAAIGAARADMGNIQLFDEDSSHLVLQTCQGFGKPFVDYFGVVEVGQTACGVAVQLCRRVIVDDVTESEIFRHGSSLEMLLDSHVRSVQSTPLIGTRGQLLGVLSTHSSKPGRPALKELRSLNYFSALAGALIEWQNAARPVSRGGMHLSNMV